MLGERLPGGWASAGEAGQPPVGLALGSHSAATNRPRDQEQVTPPHELQFGNGDTPPNLLCGWEVQMGRPGDRLVSLPDQPCFVFPFRKGELLPPSTPSLGKPPACDWFECVAVTFHLIVSPHPPDPEFSSQCLQGIRGGGGAAGTLLPPQGGPGPLAFLLSPSPTCPLPSRARVGCYLVTVLQEDVLSRNEPLVPRNDEIAGCVVFVLQGPDDKHF